MNIFCYPGVARRRSLCALLGIEPGLRPGFGFKPRIALKSGLADRSEMDMRLGQLLVEAKLTESDFQTARRDLVLRYRDLEAVFNVEQLPMRKERFRSCQLIRGALAAEAHGASFVVFCDQRRQDLIEECFATMAAVVSAELRCRLSVVTWQELAVTLPRKVRSFPSREVRHLMSWRSGCPRVAHSSPLWGLSGINGPTQYRPRCANVC